MCTSILMCTKFSCTCSQGRQYSVKTRKHFVGNLLALFTEACFQHAPTISARNIYSCTSMKVKNGSFFTYTILMKCWTDI